MLAKMRSAGGSIVTKLLLGILVLSFAVWGISDYVIGSGGTTAVTLNGDNISIQEINTAYDRQIRKLTQEFGEPVSQEAANALGVPTMVMVEVMRNKLLEQQASGLGIKLSKAELFKEIESNPAFADSQTGKFNLKIYKQILQNNGWSVEAYERAIATTRLQSLMLNELFNSNVNDSDTINRLVDFENALIDVNFIELNKSMVAKPVMPSEDELKAIFEKTQDRFTRPEYRLIENIVIDQNDITASINISEQVALEEFNAHPESYAVPEKRKARHILLKSEDEANSVIQQLMDGADFATLAKSLSADKFTAKKGGDLGAFASKDMVSEFSEAVFSMKTGEISDTPVKSAFGFHVIKLEEIIPAEQRSFETVKTAIIDELKASESADAMFELQAEVEDRLAGGEKLEDIAKDLKLKYSKFNFVDNFGNSPEGETVKIDPTVLAKAFSLEEAGIASEAIDLAGGRQMGFVNILEIDYSRPQTFAEAKNELIKSEMNLRHVAAVRKYAADIVQDAVKTSFENAIKKQKLSKKVAVVENISRIGANTPAWMGSNHRKALFNLKVDEVLDYSIDNGEKYIVVAVKSHSKAKKNEEILEAKQAMFNQNINNDLRQAFLENVASKAIVSYNVPLLKRVFGNDFSQMQLPIRENNNILNKIKAAF